MDEKVKEIAQRLRDLREICEFDVKTMAEVTETSVEDYKELEAGNREFSINFLYNCAKKFNVDIIELLTGDKPKLSHYSITRSGKGVPMRRRNDFSYQHLIPNFKNKTAEIFNVTAKYNMDEQDMPIRLSSHKGQEFDLIISGQMKFQIEDVVEILNAGDCIYFDSSYHHGMIATGGEDCEFLAVVMKHE